MLASKVNLKEYNLRARDLHAEFIYSFNRESERKVEDGKVPIYTGNPDLWNPLDPSFTKQ